MVGCSTDQEIREDNARIDAIVKRELHAGMTAEKVAEVFEKHGTPLGELIPCSDATHLGPDCSDGYWAIGVVELGNRGIWLGEGQAQVNMTFDQAKKLEDGYFFEIYYEKMH